MVAVSAVGSENGTRRSGSLVLLLSESLSGGIFFGRLKMSELIHSGRAHDGGIGKVCG